MTIDDGRQFWSFRPVTNPSLPEVQNPGWVQTPIDAFVLAKLEANQIHPAPQADKRTLIRRLTYDLIGLPPTPDEVNAFVADESPNAYQVLVERLSEFDRLWRSLGVAIGSTSHATRTPTG